jgi:hypothetical protein
MEFTPSHYYVDLIHEPPFGRENAVVLELDALLKIVAATCI